VLAFAGAKPADVPFGDVMVTVQVGVLAQFGAVYVQALLAGLEFHATSSS
jgi:1,4-dihydroxy-2-naphthoate octaprenyltransferase